MKRSLQISAMVGLILMTFIPEILSAQPKPTVIMNQAYDYTGTWEDVGKTTFEYVTNNQTIQTEYGWIPPDWTPINRTITTVDEHDNTTEYILEMFQDGDWSPMIHWVYINTYQNGRLMEVKQSMPGMIEFELFINREVYTYDTNGKLMQITQQLSLGTTWADIGRTVYHYQGNDIDYVTIESYDEESTSWVYDQKTVHSYSDGTLFSLEEFEWDESSWVPIELHEYYYNGDASINYIVVKDWEDGSYEIQRRFVYLYGETSVDERSLGLPKAFTLSNYPNPFNPETTIQFSIDADVRVSLVVFDIMGRKVRSLLSGEFRQTGVHQLKWDGRDDSGRIQPSGSYIFRISTPDRSISKTCLLIK